MTEWNENKSEDGFENDLDNEKFSVYDEMHIPFTELIYGVVFAPGNTFQLFNHVRPWKKALLFLLSVSVIVMLLSTLGGGQFELSNLPFKFPVLNMAKAQIGVFLGVIIFPFSILFYMIMTGFLHLTAEMLGGKGNALSLFSAFSVIQIVSILSALMQFFVRLIGSGGYFLSFFFATVFFVWRIVLQIMALREIYSFSTGKAVAVFFMPLILFIGIGIFAMISALIFAGHMLSTNSIWTL